MIHSDGQTDQEPELAETVANGLCPVVGIGASAGGLEAFTQLLQNLPANTGMAFVLVQHLDPHHESILSELLSTQTQMPVTQAVQETSVEPNHVYIIPPNTRMEIEGGVLKLTPRTSDRARHLPIDYFLSSLAGDQHSRAIGVILSGTASDGTIGLKEIKMKGGITFAQDDSAKFNGMPRSAIAANVVDFVLSPEKIAVELGRIAQHPHFSIGTLNKADAVDEASLMNILALLREKKGVDFAHYKRPTMRRRLSRRLALLHKDSTEDYLALLQHDNAEVEALLDDLLINVTGFFRDTETFEILTRKMMPGLLEGRKPDTPIRVWVPGCSSGEEVYSIAICLIEHLERVKQSYPIQIFGTDLSDRAIESARSGKYSAAISATISPTRLNRFFIRLETGFYQIAGFIRDLCVFSRQDVTRDPPLSHMDLISCRNLLIYFGPILQRRVMSVFSYALNPRGCLLLGHSENVGSLPDHFVPLDQDHKIFARNLQFSQPALELHQLRVAAWSPPAAAPERVPDEAALIDRDADQLILADYAPSGLLIDSDFQVIKFRGDMGPYLAAPKGAATLNALKLIHEDLVGPLRTAVEEATLQNSLIRKERISITRSNRVDELNLVVRPLSKNRSSRHFLVLIEGPLQSGGRDLRPEERAPKQADKELAEELASTRSYLQSLIEELRSANEETQSTNEELQSINEELQTAKEELQSSNEELTTTNDEMQNRNQELSQANNDLLNLLSSMRVPVVMLNNQLRIRRFTPSSEKALNLIPTDIGRPISDLRPLINVPDLEERLMEVIHSVRDFEREVQDHNGHWYSLRINPYRTAENRIEGAVLQLLDVDQLKRTIEEVEHARNYAEAIIATVQEPLVVLDREMCVQTANRSFFNTFKVSPEETMAKSIFEIGGGQWNVPKLRAMLNTMLGEIVDTHARAQDVEIEHNFERIGWRTFQLNARSLQRDGNGRLILLALEDITDRKRAAEAKYRRLFETAKDGILVIDAVSGEVTDANPYVVNLFGYRREELIGKPFWETQPLVQMADARQVFVRLQSEEIVRLPDLTFASKEGRQLEVDVICNIYLEGEKRVGQFNIRDITDRKRFDQQLRQSAKLESLGLLAGGVAHDFNNLLTGIMGNAALVLDATPADSPDREALRDIVKSSQRAADLTRQMLAYSGRGRFIVRLTDFSELVRDISTLVRSSIPKSVDVELHLAADLPCIEADATQIQQLVMNLVINGAEAIGEGRRGLVRVSTAEELLDAETIKRQFPGADISPGRYVSLDVTDSGSGMDGATQAKIFDPFFTTKFTGRGLGLAAALGIVKGHRGAIRVYSAPGRGTTFKVVFPASVFEEKVAAPPAVSLEELHGSGLVLVVDDEEMVRSLAAAALRRYGYQALTAPNGEAALKIVRERGADLALVILDLMMPLMGGEEALTRIREILPDLPVILSSGYDEMQVAKQIDPSLVAGFVQKPYVIQSLLETVKAAISHR